MSRSRRIGVVEVTGHEAAPGGGLNVILMRALHGKSRVVIHFHTRIVAEEFYPVGHRFELILEPVSR